jgi:hypothetical protein
MAGDGRGRSRRPVLLLALALVLAWLLWLGVHLVFAAVDIRAGVDAAEAARAKASAPSDIASGRPLADLRRARQRFDRAHQRLTARPWVPIRTLPFLGRQLRSLSSLAGAAAQVADVGASGIADVGRLLEGQPPTGAARAELVRELAEVAGEADRRLASVGLGPRRALLRPLASRRNELADELDDLRTGLQRGSIGGRALSDFLMGPRRYLVVAANNSEMRAGSGMILSLGELETRDGTLRLGPMTTVTEIEVPPGVPVEGDYADRWGWLKPTEDWRNLMLSPRFDVSAPLAARMWTSTDKAPVDGVLALDPVTVQAVLAATGPVSVEGMAISADNVLEELLYQQYLRFPVEETEARREQLGAIARVTFDALERSEVAVPALAGGLAKAARGRHLMVWSANPGEQQAWAAAGVAGALSTDSLLVSVVNRGGNKLDYFLEVAAELNFMPGAKDTDCTLRLLLRNRVPPDQPRYIAGPHRLSGVGKGVYLGILAATLPGTARNSRIDGVDRLAVAGPDGPTRVIGFQLTVPPGESRTVTIRFVLPGQRGSVTVEPSARLPAIQWTSAGKRWSDEGSHRLSWGADEETR